jgi:hypothetical protein
MMKMSSRALPRRLFSGLGSPDRLLVRGAGIRRPEELPRETAPPMAYYKT